LKRELALLAPFADLYIAMHDTTTDAVDGEAVRRNGRRQHVPAHTHARTL
jgi:hypothetical protein